MEAVYDTVHYGMSLSQEEQLLRLLTIIIILLEEYFCEETVFIILKT